MATVTWIGKRQITRYSRPYTAGGTTTGTYGFTINGKTVSITGDGGTAAFQAASLQAALAASTEPEFAECTWTVSGAVVTVTGPADGAPLTISTSVSGSATLTAGTATSATSPFDLADTANYSGGALPSNNDTLVFPANSADVLYGLDALTSVTGLTIKREANGPKIGLQDWKAPGYREYRQTTLITAATTLNIDLGTEQGFRTLRFDLKGTPTTTAYVVGQNATAAGQESLEIQRPGTLTCYISGGSVAVTPGSGGSLAMTLLSAVNGATASVGTGITVTTLTYNQSGGIVESSFTTLNQNGGTTEVRGTAAGTPVIDAGTVSWKGTGTITNAVLGSGGLLDTSAGVGAITVSGAIVMNEGSSLNDPTARLTKTYSIQLNRTGIGGVSLSVGEHCKVTVDTY